MTQRLSEASNTSPSPHSPVSSGHDWLSNKRRSHSFTSGFFAVINLNDPQRVCWESQTAVCCLLMFSLLFSLSNLSEDQTGHVAHDCRQRPGKRLQLLRDSRSWRQVIRQSGHKQQLWPPAAGLSWMAAGHLSGLCSEELRQPATAPQQVRLQKVLWQKGPLSYLNDFLLIKGFTNSF